MKRGERGFWVRAECPECHESLHRVQIMPKGTGGTVPQTGASVNGYSIGACLKHGFFNIKLEIKKVAG